MNAAALAVALPGLTDEQLAVSYTDGVDGCFDELVRRYGGPLYAFALRMVGKPEDADDLVQDVFVQLLKSLPTARPGMPLRPWVYVIARNKCLDHLKRKKALAFSSLATDEGGEGIEERLEDAEPLPEELAERADLRELLQAAIATLPPRYRAVVALRYSTDLTFAEIGAVLELPENTVKTHFQRAKGMLRGALRERL